MKLRKCLQCKRAFVGSIDPRRAFCSIRCSLDHGPLTAKEVKNYPLPVEKKKKERVRKPRQRTARVRSLEKEIKSLKEKLKKELKISPSFKKSFYTSEAWRYLRYKVLRSQGRICKCCRTIKGVMHVDHIKPRSTHPLLELEISNLQVLCEACNLGKSNSDGIDWR